MCREELIKAFRAGKKKTCFESSTVAEEKGKKFELRNKSRKTVCRVKVDGCLINDHKTKRCDFLFKVCETETHFLVELKGTDVDKAVDQIIHTFEFVNRKLRLPAESFKGVIVSSSIPRAAEQRFRTLKEKCYRDKRLMIKKESQRCMITI